MGSGSNAKRQTSQGNVQDDKEDENVSSQVKKHRKRTKKLVSQLKQQIEFYFSNSNLQKDRFLKQEIIKNPDGYIQIKIIADFNKMKQMTDDIGLVIKAMKSSELLQLNDDETMVKRATPLPEAKNVDAETIYVENLPPNTNHDWLKKTFAQFGTVTYVSIPRFKHTYDIKGFAFIEFENSTEASDAVKAFHVETEEKENGQNEDQKPKRRKRSHSESDVDSSKQSTKAERKRRRTTSESSADSQEGNLDSPKKKQRIVLPECQPKIEAVNEGSESLDVGKARKRKKNDKSVHWKPKNNESQSDTKVTKTESGEEEKPIKKEKASESEPEDNKSQSDTKVTHPKTESEEEEKPIKKGKGSESDSNAENPESEEEGKKKKHKKRKRKVKEKKEGKLPQLRVIPKLEWMRLKAEYKKLQRESMQELKKQLQDCADKQGDDTQEKKPENKPTQKKEENKDQSTTVKELPFTPDVVLHFKCMGTDLPKSEIRERITVHAPIAYIDVKEGAGEGYVRFHTVENCSTVIDNISKDASSGLELVKVTGEQERDYWRKINAERVERFQAKRERKRGTEKVARKVDAVQVHQQVSHIRFDNE